MDESGNLYVLSEVGSNFPTTPGVFQESHGGGKEVYLSCFKSDDTLSWATYIGGNEDDYGRFLEYENGFLFVGGKRESQDFPNTSGTPYTPTQNILIAPLIAKFNANDGSVAYVHTYSDDSELIIKIRFNFYPRVLRCSDSIPVTLFLELTFLFPNLYLSLKLNRRLSEKETVLATRPLKDDVPLNLSE